MRVTNCKLERLKTILINYYYGGNAALTISNGTKVLICFDHFTEKDCEVFDGVNSKLIKSTRMAHTYGGFGFYKGRPTAIGGMEYPTPSIGFTETLTETGWKKLDNHPIWIVGHSAIGLPSGSIATLGGKDFKEGKTMKGIWLFDDLGWRVIGNLIQYNFFGSSILVDNVIYLFPGETNQSKRIIQRVNLDGNDVVDVENIGDHQNFFNYPIIMLTPVNYCNV